MPAQPPEHPQRNGLESPRIYEDMRRLAAAQMRHQPASHTLTATALVHEAYLKLHGRDEPASTQHLMGLAARAMRSILVDHARRKGRDKRRAVGERVPIERLLGEDGAPIDVLALDDHLAKLERFDPDLAELVELKGFGGMSEAEIVQATGKPLRTVQRHLALARAWLETELA